MTASEWIVFILAIQVVHFLGTFRLYQKAGRKSWEAIVPVYNAIVLMQIIRRPKWWVILLFVPIINLMMFPVIWVETLRSFGRNRSIDTILGILTFGLYIFIPNFDSKTTYDKDRDLNSKTWFGEWISALLFAIIAATLVHSYFIQPYIIPTGSLEKTLLIGDFLFVSKFHYGARTPTSAVSFPMVHDTIPIIKKRSYLKKPQLPYFRLPGFQDVKRNDIVVFSWPADTVRKFFVREKGVQKPIDKKSNYVKRCVGTPGDSLEIINGFVHINGEKSILPDRAKTQYTHYGYNSKGVSSRKLLNAGYKDFTRKYRIENITQERYNALQPYILGRLSDDINNFIVITPSAGIPPKVLGELRLSAKELLDAKKDLTLTIAEAKEILNTGIVDSIVQKVTRTKRANTNFFPNAIPYNWNEDNFGPILIPKAGMTVEINEKTLPLYKKIIREYEKKELTKEGASIFINGKETTSYTFQQDYYWMMGDNRHRSEDSRYWGYVPEDHVVGKPVLVWFSIEGINDGIKNWRIRWDRIMTTVGGNGEPISFFPYVLALFLGWQGWVYFRKRKKA
ncbi:MAG: signal peptidase I [Flavobacteriales bacterium]|jgi:signal peptidase I|tara:strand:- start:903 stop:2597 length:1695 start_codon:yes stop_codon:yes gene_type:complete